MNKVFTACEIPDEELHENALFTLRDIGQVQYDHIEPYFEKVAHITSKAISSDSSTIGATAFEFWTTLATVELER